MTPDEIIAACTRCGVTSWQNVARQLGISVDAARARHDPGYERAYVWAPSRSPMAQADPEDLIEPDDADIPTSSPYVRGPGLKVEILCLLIHHGGLTVETLASMLNRTKLSVRKRLNDMRGELLVCNDSGGQHGSGTFGWTWTITAVGKGFVTAHAPGAKERA